jgi:hypothetical protein
MLAHNEKSGIEVIADFSDATGTPTLPTTVHYRVDCETTKRPLLDWTPITVQSETTTAGEVRYFVEIDIPGSVNAIQSNRNRREVKTVLIVANKDLDSEYSQEYQYIVKNVQGRT